MRRAASAPEDETMTTIDHHTVEDLKVQGHYFAAGVLAATIGGECNYGCHFGMRSELEFARSEFRQGYNAGKGHQ